MTYEEQVASIVLETYKSKKFRRKFRGFVKNLDNPNNGALADTPIDSKLLNKDDKIM